MAPQTKTPHVSASPGPLGLSLWVPRIPGSGRRLLPSPRRRMLTPNAAQCNGYSVRWLGCSSGSVRDKIPRSLLLLYVRFLTRSSTSPFPLALHIVTFVPIAVASKDICISHSSCRSHVARLRSGHPAALPCLVCFVHSFYTCVLLQSCYPCYRHLSLLP
ncbi:hypothetical protein BC629DRAFT_259370 [Irpex lacteus]|nr:hypothetical protein BC629DRAFT_259370 [Irpex lacteus]